MAKRIKKTIAVDNDAQYKYLLANVLDGILVFDVETMKIVLANHAAANITGFSSPEDMVGVDIVKSLPEEDRNRILSLLTNVLGRESGQPAEDVRIPTKDGREIWISGTCNKIEFQGRSAGLVTLREVTDRKRAEERLLTSQERNRLLIENANEGIIVIQDEVLKFANPKAEEIFGYTAQELMLKPVADIIHPADREMVMVQHSTRLSGKEVPHVCQFRIAGKDDNLKWVELNGVLFSWGGRPADLCFVNDITQRKLAEEALCQSEERFRSLVDNISDWVWEVDTRGIYTYVSPRVRKILGYEPGEVIGKTLFDFMAAQEGNRFSGIFESCLKDKRSFTFLENVCLHKDGHKVFLEKSAVPFFDADGNVCGYRGVDRDITERKRAEEQLHDSYRRLEESLDGVIQAMAVTVEIRDRHTAGHQNRVTELAYAIARELGLSRERSRAVRIAGLLHDLGKMIIPTEILSKPGRLTDVEFAIIRSHPKAGYDILINIDFPWPIAEIVVQHHERVDGSGYPYGLKGDQSTLESRILAVADVVEAMSSHRPYRPSLGLDKALEEIMSNRGLLYDTDVVDACLKVFNQGRFKFTDQPA